MVCNACYNSNWDGIVPDTYPHLASRIESLGIDVSHNAKG
jgi:hypothetical protein